MTKINNLEFFYVKLDIIKFSSTYPFKGKIIACYYSPKTGEYEDYKHINSTVYRLKPDNICFGGRSKTFIYHLIEIDYNKRNII